jgi:hypothetical protein
MFTNFNFETIPLGGMELTNKMKIKNWAKPKLKVENISILHTMTRNVTKKFGQFNKKAIKKLLTDLGSIQ